MYQRILVPVDGSETSRAGLAEAVKLGQLTGATLRLVEPALRLLTIRDVPHVCVRDFKFSDNGVEQ